MLVDFYMRSIFVDLLLSRVSGPESILLVDFYLPGLH